jgi:hypothetical protein
MNSDLTKIAGSGATHLEKCAAIAGLYANGNITAEEGNNAATSMGIDPEDVASVYRINYEDLGKTAVEGDTYLEKTASIADAIASGDLSDVDDIANVTVAHGIDVNDLEAIYNRAYEPAELDKTAALQEANNILASPEATYLQKTAAIADMYNQGIVTSEDATKAAQSLGISVDDVNAFLDKEAADADSTTGGGSSTDKKKTWDAIKDRAGKMKQGVVDAGKWVGDKATSAGRWVGANKGKAGIGAGILAAAGGGTAYALNKKKDN